MTTTSSLAMVSKMLQPQGYDSNFLGLQTLSSLADAFKMGSRAKTIVKELLRPGNEVGRKVAALIVDTKEEDEMFKLRTLSVTILANALHAIQGNISAELREELKPFLIQDLRNVERTSALLFKRPAVSNELWRSTSRALPTLTKGSRLPKQ